MPTTRQWSRRRWPPCRRRRRRISGSRLIGEPETRCDRLEASFPGDPASAELFIAGERRLHVRRAGAARWRTARWSSPYRVDLPARQARGRRAALHAGRPTPARSAGCCPISDPRLCAALALDVGRLAIVCNLTPSDNPMQRNLDDHFRWRQAARSDLQDDDRRRRRRTLTSPTIFAGKKVVLFGVPGAFTPTCSNNHLPGYLENRDAILARGVDTIAVVAVNDVHVMGAWARFTGGEGKILYPRRRQWRLRHGGRPRRRPDGRRHGPPLEALLDDRRRRQGDGAQRRDASRASTIPARRRSSNSSELWSTACGAALSGRPSSRPRRGRRGRTEAARPA